MNVIIYKKNASTPRLSDEEPDLMEQEDSDGISGMHGDGWTPWTGDDLIDVRRIIATKLSDKQRAVIEAYLMGYTADDLGVTDKYWSYHFKKALEKLKKEMKSE